MSTFVQKVEQFVAIQKARKEVEQNRINSINSKKEQIHVTICAAMSDLFNNSTLQTNYRELIQFSPETEVYIIVIDNYQFEVKKSNIEKQIEKDPNRSLREIVDQDILRQLENTDLMIF